MSRYIDADRLKARLDIVSVDAITLYEMGINAGLHRAEAEIELLPTADVVEVAKCKADTAKYLIDRIKGYYEVHKGRIRTASLIYYIEQIAKEMLEGNNE